MIYQIPGRSDKCTLNLYNVTHLRVNFKQDGWYELTHKKGTKRRHLPFTKQKYYENNIYEDFFGHSYTEEEMLKEHIIVDGKLYELPEVIIYFVNEKTFHIQCKTLEEANKIYDEISALIDSIKKEETSGNIA
jgi:hypothetical protein